MKKFVFVFLVFLSSKFSSGQDFFCPNEINFGDFNIIAKTDTSSDFTISYSPYFSIYKLVKDEIFFQDGIVKPLYDSSIVKNGNYLQFLKASNNKDTIEISFRLFYKYLDSISSLGEFLEYEFTFLYLKNGNDILDSQKVKIKLRLKSEKELFKAHENFHPFILRSSNKYGDSSKTDFWHGYLLNFTENNFIIDSVKQEIEGKNFFKYTVDPADSIKFPYKLATRNRITFRHWYRFLIPEIGRSVINFYGHFENNNQLVVLNDTNQISFDISDGIYYYIASMKYYHSIYAVDTVKMPTITISNNTDSLLKFISFNINSAPGLLAYFKKVATEPPVDINPWNRYSIKEIYIQADNPGKYRLKVAMNFEKANGEKFFKDMDLVVEAIPKRITDISNSDDLFEIFISPNPATDYIDIVCDNHTLKGVVNDISVYDLLGVMVSLGIDTPHAPSQEGVSINVSHLAPGVYFVRVADKIQKFVKY